MKQKNHQDIRSNISYLFSLKKSSLMLNTFLHSDELDHQPNFH